MGAREGGQKGLYDAGSVTWKINREAALLLGGGRALLMQLAHPLVAAGVDRHSDFRSRPARRLRRTLELTLSMVFGSREAALEAARQINGAHRPVRGRLADGSGGVPAGTAYSARDPDLLLWVHATLVDSAVVTYQAFVGRLTDAEREAYLAESRLVGELLGIPGDDFWPDWGSFQNYLSEMYAGPVQVSDQARELAASVLRPGLRLVPPFAYLPLNLITTSLLPAPLRDGYRLPFGLPQRAALAAAVVAVPALLRAAPAPVRLMAAFRRTARRVTPEQAG